MNPNEVVVSILNRQRSYVVLKFLGESVSQPGESAVSHADGEILPLHVAGANMLPVGRAPHRVLFAGDASGWAVPLLALGIGAVNLNNLRIVNHPSESLDNRQEVHLVAIGSQLDSIRQTPRNVIKERLGGLGIAVPDHPTQDKFAVSIDCYERPSIASETLGLNRRSDVLCFRGHKAPKFINLPRFDFRFTSVRFR